MRTITKRLTAVAAAATLAATGAACSSSGSAKPIANVSSLSGNTTTVALDSGFLAALTSLKLQPGTVGTATLSAPNVTFPITGGNVKVYKKGDVTPYVQGKIEHNGSGISLTNGTTKVELTNFVVDPGNNSNITGDVSANGKSVVKGAKLFDLHGSTLQPITTSGGVATLTGTRVNLSSAAAGLLDKTYGTTAVKGGLFVGVATLKVKVS